MLDEMTFYFVLGEVDKFKWVDSLKKALGGGRNVVVIGDYIDIICQRTFKDTLIGYHFSLGLRMISMSAPTSKVQKIWLVGWIHSTGTNGVARFPIYYGLLSMR